MPHSKKAGKANIVEWVEQLKTENKIVHNSALDIGVGEGAYLNWLNTNVFREEINFRP